MLDATQIIALKWLGIVACGIGLATLAEVAILKAIDRRRNAQQHRLAQSVSRARRYDNGNP